MAKRFTFRLETLLRIRTMREREAKRNVGAKQAEIAQLDQLNRKTAEEIGRRQAALRDHQHGVLAPAELVRQRAWIAHLRNTIAQRQAARRELVEELDRLLVEWRETRTRKRIIEKLRQRRWAQYRRDRGRREQAEADELAQQLHGFGGASARRDVMP